MTHSSSINNSNFICLCSSIYIILIQPDGVIPFIMLIVILFHARCTANCISTLSTPFSPFAPILSLLLAKHLFSFHYLFRPPLSPPLKTSTSNNNIPIYYIKKDYLDSIQLWPVSVIPNHKTALCSVKKLYLTTRTPFT